MLSVTGARQLAREHLVHIAQGRDPAAERRQERAAPAHGVTTFKQLAELYMTVCETGEWSPKGKLKKESVRREERRLLDVNILPTLGRYRYDSITRQEVKALLRAQFAKGGRTTVNRTHAVIHQVFNFPISEDLVKANPATGFTRFSPERPRERVWKEAEWRKLCFGLGDLAALNRRNGENANVGEAMAIAIKLVLLLGQRRGEVG